MLVLFHVPAASAAAAVVSYHAIQLTVPALLGGAALLRLRPVLRGDAPDNASAERRIRRSGRSQNPSSEQKV